MNPELLAEKTTDLFSLPAVTMRIYELLDSPCASQYQLEELIKLDPSLSTKLLKTANASYASVFGQIDSIGLAISLIDEKELRNLIMDTSFSHSFSGIPNHLVDMHIFWFHSITTGFLAKGIAEHCGMYDSERFFLPGLLHGVGKLVMFEAFPEEISKILSSKKGCSIEMASQERKAFGFTHAEAGAALLKNWQLPEYIWHMIGHKMQPLEAPDRVDEVSVLSAAVAIADVIEPCANVEINLQDINLDFHAPVFQHLQLSEFDIRALIQEAGIDAFDVLASIHPEVTVIY